MAADQPGGEWIAKVKKFTKIAPVRAGKLSTAAFCTEFRRESNRADGISPNPLFWKVNFLGFPTYFLYFLPVWGLRWGYIFDENESLGFST